MQPDLLSKVLLAAGNTDSNSTESKPSKEELVSSRPTLHSRDKEMVKYVYKQLIKV